ncbi:TonB-dependent receptor [Prolixibacteraceae bacterium JC049]|nr:TonB-dependent receptor [Prolixibacteraceae bacterium JC049]
MFLRRIATTLILIFIASVIVSAQQLQVSGIITNSHNNKPVPYATIGIQKLNLWAISDFRGKFSFSKIPMGIIEFEVRCLGFRTQTQKLNTEANKFIVVALQPENLKLETVTVTATEKQEKGTKSLINQQAMQHIQPASFADLLQLLPGNTSVSTKMSQVSSIQLRQAATDNNTALGTAFIIDGIPVSNNANLQYIPNSGNNDKIRGRVNVTNGMDLRSISTDDIESVEIIRGVPSVAYGDLTSGAVIIKRKQGISKHKFRIKSNLKQKLLAWSKGFTISPNSGVFNFDLSYLNHTSDPSNPLEKYQRINSSLRYSNNISLFNKPLEIKTSASTIFTIDKEKVDPELNYNQPDYYKSDYTRNSLGGSALLKINKNWLQQIELKLRGSIVNTKLVRERIVRPVGPTPVPQVGVIGVHDSEYLPDVYLAQSVVDGAPANLYSALIFSGQFPFIPWINTFKMGTEWSWDKNLGKGEQTDPSRPIFPGSWNVNPRNFSTIPSIQRLSNYFEEQITIPIKKHQLKLQAGVRTITPLNISSKYYLSGKTFIDPRINLTWKMPTLTIANKPVSVNWHIGTGWHTKLPVIAQLYPNEIYRSIIQLNYYSQNPDLRRLNLYSYKKDPTNYDLKPARNRKFELGLRIKYNKASLSITAFDEYMSSGFTSRRTYHSVKYTDYIAGSVPSTGLTAPPALSLFDYKVKQRLFNYSSTANAAYMRKQGIEYTLKLPKWKALHTTVTINGAYFKTRYDNSLPVTYKPSQVINNEPYPYVGIYSSSRSSKIYRHFNTRFLLETHIPRLRMVATTSLQSVWFKNHNNLKTDKFPISYIDAAGVEHPFTSNDANDLLLSYLVLKFPKQYLEPDKTPISMSLNFKLTKELGNQLSLAFYVHNLLDYNPSYKNKYGGTVYRTASPSFGMEINIKI